MGRKKIYKTKEEKEEHLKEYRKEYYKKNKKYFYKKGEEWRKNNRERYLEARSEWSKKNRKKLNKRQREYYRNSEERRFKVKGICRLRETNCKDRADGSVTFESWERLKRACRFTCPCCGKGEPEIELTIDHIVPLSKGGTHTIENIQPLCRSCNSSKNNFNSEKYI